MSLHPHLVADGDATAGKPWRLIPCHPQDLGQHFLPNEKLDIAWALNCRV